MLEQPVLLVYQLLVLRLQFLRLRLLIMLIRRVLKGLLFVVSKEDVLLFYQCGLFGLRFVVELVEHVIDVVDISFFFLLVRPKRPVFVNAHFHSI